MKYLLIIFLFIRFLVFSDNLQKKECKILIGSIINQKPIILKEFLNSFHHLEKKIYVEDYFFINDTSVIESEQLLTI